MAGFELLGWKIEKKTTKSEDLTPAIVPKEEDGALEIFSGIGISGQAFGSYVDFEGKFKNEAQLITKYRNLAAQPEPDVAIQDIVNEAITIDSDDQSVSIVLDQLESLDDSIKEKIRKEFEYLLSVLNFSNEGYDIFKRWYVDGRLYYHILIDKKNSRKGIRQLRMIDPRKIKKVKEGVKEKDSRTGAEIIKGYHQYYLFNQDGFINSSGEKGVKLSNDSVIYTTSGIFDETNTLVLSNIHKAIKPINQLRMLEDAVAIYRISRAPERRVFYIDVGNLPKIKAEQHIRDMMVRYKNKVVYDANTGEIRDDRKYMNMLEDFWLPRREGGRGTEISTLDGGQNLGEMEDVDYFRRRLYKALNVPISRMESENTFSLGRSGEIDRDEVKFTKFIKRLRNRFATLFDELLEIHLALRGIMHRNDFQKIKQLITYDFATDNEYVELKEAEILRDRIGLLGEVDQFVGKYFSMEYACKKILRMTDEEIKIEKERMEKEKSSEEENSSEEEKSSEEIQDPFDQEDNPSFGQQDDDGNDFGEFPPKKNENPFANNTLTPVPDDDDEDNKKEEFVPPKELTEDEKKLIKSMTKYFDGDLNHIVDHGNTAPIAE